MNELVKTSVVQNFLASLDMQMKFEENCLNAINDSFSYGWNGATLREIMAGIEAAYSKKTNLKN